MVITSTHPLLEVHMMHWAWLTNQECIPRLYHHRDGIAIGKLQACILTVVAGQLGQ